MLQDPLAPVTVTATSGTLNGVVMTNEQRIRIRGIMTPDNAVWKPGVPLGYGRTYTLAVDATGSDSKVAQQVSAFSTLIPRNQTKGSFTTTARTPLDDGQIRAVFVVSDTIKNSSRAAIADLRALGLTPVLLTGDNGRAA